MWDRLVRFHRGREHAISGDQLSRYIGVDKRTIQVAVERLRNLRGKLIASATASDGGYFYPVDEAEADEHIGALRARACRQQAGASQQERARDARFHPERLRKPQQFNLPFAAG